MMKKILGISAPIAAAGAAIFLTQTDQGIKLIYDNVSKSTAVTLLYIKYLRRMPDTKGHDGWVRAADRNNWDYSALRREFIAGGVNERAARGIPEPV